MRPDGASDNRVRASPVRRDTAHSGSRAVVELVGPAGAGKTTLADALQGFDPASHIGRARLLGALISQAPVLAASRLSAGGRFWSRAELRSLAYLGAWQARVRAGRDQGLMVLDHGPVYRLASLQAFGPPMTRTWAFTRLWYRLARQWGELLDAVIWLDAPDEVLLNRIANRQRHHRIRGIAPGEARTFLACYRAVYRATLVAVTDSGTPLVELDTAAYRPDELADVVRAVVRESRDGSPR